MRGGKEGGREGGTEQIRSDEEEETLIISIRAGEWGGGERMS